MTHFHDLVETLALEENAASHVIAGVFTQLLIGIRSIIRVEILRERFMDNLQFGMIAQARIDFTAARQSAFMVLDGVTPA